MKLFFAKLAYGLLFCGLLPLGLWAWARATAAVVRLPVPAVSAAVGWGCVGVGLLAGLAAMRRLWTEGRGLPMNAFPPRRLVRGGLYRWLPHPIYVGASLVSGGAALLTGSASGFWLVTPALTLAWLALVYGFENSDLRRRFPGRPAAGALLRLPAATAARAPLGQRLRVALLVGLPWALLYETVIFLGPSARPVSTFLPCEARWPVWAPAEVLYALTYPFAALAPLLLRRQKHLRRWAMAGWLATGAGIFLQLTLPLVAAPRPLAPGDVGGWAALLLAERAHDGATAALPSFHVVWAALGAYAWGQRFGRARGLFGGLAVLIGLSCLATGQHSLADVLAGAGPAALALRHLRAWRRLRAGLQRLANSWAARRLGPLRVINHSLYAGLAMGAGVLLAGCLLPRPLALLAPVGLGLLGAGLWGQLVEGSALSRPFGYYGSLLGGVAGCALGAPLAGVPFWTLLAACTLTLPLVQGLGRLRCLVQGCCHGRRGPAPVSIRVWHPRSRVCAVAQLAGQPVHATPAYSMLANLLTGLVLFRLAYERLPAPFVVGLYLLLTGLARFVEEQFRGEPQTPRAAGLTLYQWLAVALVLLGAALTALPAPPLTLALRWQPLALPLAAGAAALAAFALGMDFPDSKQRFSRLAGV